MKISVIVPYKDAEEWLGRCLDSLCVQEGNFEFILVNDSSKDSSRSVASSYKDRRVVCIDNAHKPGVSGARNTGLDYATGNYITFLDADDTMMPGAYEMFTRAVNANENANMIQFNHYRYYAPIDKTALKYTNPNKVFEAPDLPVLWCVVWNKLYRASFLKDIRFNENLRFGEDELFNLDCLAKEGRIVCIKSITTTHYFDNENSLSRVKTEQDIIRQAQAMTTFVKNHKGSKIRKAACLRLSEHWSHLFIDSLTD